MSDTGGGHRACSKALQEALIEIRPDLQVEIVDGFKASGVFPLAYMPKLYTRWSEKRNLWRTTFHLTNGRRWSNVVFYPLEKRTSPILRRALTKSSPDLVVVLHPCLTNVTYKALSTVPNRPRISTVVTDLVYGHASWFAHGADEYYVPTEAMRQRALKKAIPDDRITVTGLPLATRLFQLRDQKKQLRESLGFTGPTVICVGGAYGMAIQRMAPALMKLPKTITLHIICGKNQPLYDRLTRKGLPSHVKVHGFVSNLPEMLAAADVALIKASPTVLMEAVAVGTYVMLYDYMPGQEYPNVRYVQDNKLGDYSRSPKAIGAKITEYVCGLAHIPFAERGMDFVPPDGARTIARRLLGVDTEKPA